MAGPEKVAKVVAAAMPVTEVPEYSLMDPEALEAPVAKADRPTAAMEPELPTAAVVWVAMVAPAEMPGIQERAYKPSKA